MQNTYERHFPPKRVKLNKYQHKLSNWITTGILKSIEFRDNLYKRLKLCPIESPEYETHKYNLKMYQGYLNQCIRTAKKEYYVNEFTKYKNDIRKTWDTLKGIICKNKMKSEYPRNFIDRGQQIAGDKILLTNLMNILHKSDRVWQIQSISPTRRLLTLILRNQTLLLFNSNIQMCLMCRKSSKTWNQNLARAMITFPPSYFDR